MTHDPGQHLTATARTLYEMGLPHSHLADLYDDEGAQVYDELVGRTTADIAQISAEVRRSGGPVLDLACGSGRVTLPLAQQGWHVTAVDLSTAMLDRLRTALTHRATSVADRVHLVHGDVVDMDLGQQFATIVLAATSIVLVPGNRRAAFFSTVRRHLAPHGHLVLDYVRHDLATLAIKSHQIGVTPLVSPGAGHRFLLSEQEFDLETRQERVTLLVEDVEPDGLTIRRFVTTRKNLFSPEELRRDLAVGGLRVVREHATAVPDVDLVVCEAMP